MLSSESGPKIIRLALLNFILKIIHCLQLMLIITNSILHSTSTVSITILHVLLLSTFQVHQYIPYYNSSQLGQV